jgi:hypothetical protein
MGIKEQNKQILSVKISSQIYYQLKSQISKGKVSEFVEQTLRERFAKEDQRLELAYKEISQDQQR